MGKPGTAQKGILVGGRGRASVVVASVFIYT